VASLVLALPWTVWHFAIITNPVAPMSGASLARPSSLRIRPLGGLHRGVH
jgi:hypothetical protein